MVSIETYCYLKEIQFVQKLGQGKDGQVWQTTRPSAVKLFVGLEQYVRERNAYFRLKERHVQQINQFSLPRLLYWDDEHYAIEMEIVSPPFILDFASVWLDKPPDFSDEAISHWHEQIRERFGSKANEVFAALDSLKKRAGVYMLDTNLNNIKFTN